MPHREIEIKNRATVIVTTDGDAENLSKRRGLQVAGPIAININKNSRVVVDSNGKVRHEGTIIGYYDGQGPQKFTNGALLALREAPSITESGYTPLDLPKVLRKLGSIGVNVKAPMNALEPFKHPWLGLSFLGRLGLNHYSPKKK